MSKLSQTTQVTTQISDLLQLVYKTETGQPNLFVVRVERNKEIGQPFETFENEFAEITAAEFRMTPETARELALAILEATK